jgi:hypothetical protein
MPSMASETDGVGKEVGAGWFMARNITTPPAFFHLIGSSRNAALLSRL